jgi:ferrochelatase
MSDSHGYDAILIVSFGGPEGPDDVMPFLENVTRGRNIPRQRLEEVAEHYLAFGGVSPINEQCRGLIERLERLLEREGPRLPVYWGNRNWHPMLTDTVARMREDGVRRAVAYTTSAFSSYSSCRQYLENIEAARVAVGAGAPEIEKIRPFWNHPGFIEANASHGREAVAALAAGSCVKPRGLSPSASAPAWNGTSCSRAAADRRRCRGWSPTSATTSTAWPTRAWSR